MSDSYPEYLNPFAEDLKTKRKLTIRNSFRQLKDNLRQSFRVKKSEKVTSGQKDDTIFRRLPIASSETQTMALPRSRFHERLSLPQQNVQRSSLNPFEEEGKEEKKKNGTKFLSVRRKMKKKAPLPPNKSLSSQNVNDENSVPGSHWSLTSVETDYSSSADQTVLEESENNIRRNSMVEEFTGFNQSMNELTNDENSIPEKEENGQKVEKQKEEEDGDEKMSNVPDLVISCPNSGNDENEDNHQIHTSKNNENEITTINGNDKNLLNSEITNITNSTDNLKTSDNEEQFLYNERQSLYIAGSKDALNDAGTESDTYVGTVSLYVTGSRDDLDVANNNEVIDKNIPEIKSEDSGPIPKQRRNKLTKNILLGV